jgi:hypothetical protein
MNTEQFEWLEDNSSRDDLSGFVVHLVGDKIDFAWEFKDTIIGVSIDPIDPLSANWGTVQLSGRVHVYQSCYKPSTWILIRNNSGTGPQGPMDEYLIH